MHINDQLVRLKDKILQVQNMSCNYEKLAVCHLINNTWIFDM